MKAGKLSTRVILVFLWLFAFLLSACQPESAIGDATATPTPQPPAPTWVNPEGTVIVPTPLPTLPLSNLSQPNPVQVSEMQFFQDGTRLTIIAKFVNHMPRTTLRDIQYELISLDSAGNRLSSAVGEIRYIFPSETTGIVWEGTVRPLEIVESIEVRVHSARADEKQKKGQPFRVSTPALFIGTQQAIMTGWLSNTDAATYTNVQLSAIAYDASGVILGGGSSQMEFVKGKDKVGVSIPASHLTGTVTRVEIYPSLGPASAVLKDGNWWKAVRVEQWNLVRDVHNQLAGGAELTNLTDQLLVNSFYIITAYDDQNQVNWVEKGPIDLIWPNESTLFSPGILQAPTDSMPTHADLLIVPGEFGDFPLQYNPLSTSQLGVSDAEFPATGSANVISNLNSNLSEAFVTMLIYNTEGQIIGGGRQSCGPIPANGSLKVNIPLAGIGNLDGASLKTSVTLKRDVIIDE